MNLHVFFFGIFFALVQTLIAQENSTATFLYKIMPNHIKLQYAGNIGMVSTGIGYESSNKRWTGDLMYGFVPKRYADEAIHSITLKGTFVPIHQVYKNEIEVNWLNTGLWFNYALGKPYFLELPRYYDSGYYYFSTALHVGLFVGSDVRYKHWGLYYELGTTEKTVINYIKNTRSIPFTELWNIGLGVVFYLK